MPDDNWIPLQIHLANSLTRFLFQEYAKVEHRSEYVCTRTGQVPFATKDCPRELCQCVNSIMLHAVLPWEINSSVLTTHKRYRTKMFDRKINPQNFCDVKDVVIILLHSLQLEGCVCRKKNGLVHSVKYVLNKDRKKQLFERLLKALLRSKFN